MMSLSSIKMKSKCCQSLSQLKTRSSVLYRKRQMLESEMLLCLCLLHSSHILSTTAQSPMPLILFLSIESTRLINQLLKNRVLKSKKLLKDLKASSKIRNDKAQLRVTTQRVQMNLPTKVGIPAASIKSTWQILFSPSRKCHSP